MNTIAQMSCNPAMGGIAQGSGKGSLVPHASQFAFDSRLGFDAGTGTAVSFPSPCGGSYTWKMPSWAKENKASWWSSINTSGNVFSGNGYIDFGFTILPKFCVNFPFIGCKCTGGSINVNAYVSLYNTTIAKPASPVNYDDSPSSTLSTQLELYSLSAFHYYNNVLAGNSSYANRDPNLHAFTTTGSLLDLHDPNNGYQQASNFLSPNSLNLLYINNNDQQPNLRFGFPHIKHPVTHYQVTPFDGIYNIGNGNGFDINNNPRPDNQMHVEDPQEYIGDYLARIEVAPTDLYLSNRSIGVSTTNYTAEFEARNKIIAGRNNFNSPSEPIYTVNNFNHYLTAEGDFAVSNNSKAIFHCGDEIQLHPGFSVDQGSELEAYILPYTWSNQLFRPVAPQGSANNGNTAETSMLNIEPSPANNQSATDVQIFPNPSTGIIIISSDKSDILKIKVMDVNGKAVHEQASQGKQEVINLERLSNGLYLIELTNTDNSKHYYKCVISK